MRTRIRKRYWEVVFTNQIPRDSNGVCDSPSAKNKQIKVRTDLEPELALEVLLHEFWHAALWELDEPTVEEIAKDCARLLTRLGYHCETL